MNSWISAVVLHGDKQGREVGFPSANLDVTLLSHVERDGVYACAVEVGSSRYAGALYIGPRLVMGEDKRVLEIHIIDFDREIYGKSIQFSLGVYIRPPKQFSSTDELRAQLADDVEQCRHTH